MSARSYDVIIEGAGPAGSAAAIGLRDSGLKVALIDRANFPRDKVCGDFVMARVIKILEEVAPGIRQKIDDFPHKAVNKSTALLVDDLEPLRLDWVQRSYTLKRKDFDNLLREEACEAEEIEFLGGQKIVQVEREDTKVAVLTSAGDRIEGKFVIGAGGTHSPVARELAGFKIDHRHYGGSVRAYFSGLQNIDSTVNEVYVHSQVVPGYFWLFPISKTEANIGLGMHSTHITQNKVNLKEVFYNFIRTSPHLHSKMQNARLEGPLKGFGLPFYSKKQTINGERFVLCGDAASLIDPTNGEGIYPGVYSGLLAARKVQEFFQANDFSEKATSRYAHEIHAEFWRKMQFKAWLVRHFADKSKIHRSVAKVAIQNPRLKKVMQKII